MYRRPHYAVLLVYILINVLPINAKPVNSCKDSGLYFSLNFGPSIPLGYFKSTDYLGYGGYAMSGYGGNLAIEHPTIKPGWFGLCFNAGYYVNQFNLPSFETTMHFYLTEYHFIKYVLNRASPYKEIPILAGVFAEYSYSNFSLELKGLVGIGIIETPKISNTDSIGLNTFPIITYPPAMNFLQVQQGIEDYHQSSVIIFIYSISAEARYNLSRKFAIACNVFYMCNLLGKPANNNNFANAPLSELQAVLGLVYHLWFSLWQWASSGF